MAVSVKEVAARARVSVGTVSNVLNRPHTVKPETVARVNQAIEELGYVPNGAARQLREGRSRSIGLIVLDVGNPFFTDVVAGAEHQAVRTGLSVLLANSGGSAEREASHLELFERQRVLGLLVSPLEEDLERLRAFRERGTPVVLVDRSSNDLSFPSVSVDDVHGGELAARHFSRAGAGGSRLSGVPSTFARWATVTAAPRMRWRRWPGASLEHVGTEALSLAEGMRVGGLLRERVTNGAIDAVFAANDLLAIGVQQALLGGDRPVKIPGDVALVGYDDISFAAAAVVPITSVSQPREELGAMAVQLLDEVVARDDSSARHVVFQPQLVVRASSRPVGR